MRGKPLVWLLRAPLPANESTSALSYTTPFPAPTVAALHHQLEAVSPTTVTRRLPQFQATGLPATQNLLPLLLLQGVEGVGLGCRCRRWT